MTGCWWLVSETGLKDLNHKFLFPCSLLLQGNNYIPYLDDNIQCDLMWLRNVCFALLLTLIRSIYLLFILCFNISDYVHKITAARNLCSGPFPLVIYLLCNALSIFQITITFWLIISCLIPNPTHTLWFWQSPVLLTSLTSPFLLKFTFSTNVSWLSLTLHLCLLHHFLWPLPVLLQFSMSGSSSQPS